jgi:hypothetical protein
MLTIVIAAEIGGQKAGEYVHEGGPGGVFSLLPYVPVFAGLIILGHWLKSGPKSGSRESGKADTGTAETVAI